MPIEALSYALPSVVHSAEELSQMTGADANFIREKVGVDTRYVLGEGETGVSLSASACERLFAEHPDAEPETGVVIVCHPNTGFQDST